jgi:hypothetical protein
VRSFSPLQEFRETIRTQAANEFNVQPLEPNHGKHPSAVWDPNLRIQCLCHLKWCETSAGSPETLVNISQTIRCHNSDALRIKEIIHDAVLGHKIQVEWLHSDWYRPGLGNASLPTIYDAEVMEKVWVTLSYFHSKVSSLVSAGRDYTVTSRRKWKCLAFQSCHLLSWIWAIRDHLRSDRNNTVRAETPVVIFTLAAKILEPSVPEKRPVSLDMRANGDR